MSYRHSIHTRLRQWNHTLATHLLSAMSDRHMKSILQGHLPLPLYGPNSPPNPCHHPKPSPFSLFPPKWPLGSYFWRLTYLKPKACGLLGRYLLPPVLLASPHSYYKFILLMVLTAVVFSLLQQRKISQSSTLSKVYIFQLVSKLVSGRLIVLENIIFTQQIKFFQSVSLLQYNSIFP